MQNEMYLLFLIFYQKVDFKLYIRSFAANVPAVTTNVVYPTVSDSYVRNSKKKTLENRQCKIKCLFIVFHFLPKSRF